MATGLLKDVLLSIYHRTQSLEDCELALKLFYYLSTADIFMMLHFI